jgi:hypothetical protein
MDKKKEIKFRIAILDFLFEYKKINFLVILFQHLDQYEPIINLLSLIKIQKRTKKINSKHADQILSSYEKIKKIKLEILNLYIPSSLQTKFKQSILESLIYFKKSICFSKLWENDLQSLIIEIIPKNIIDSITNSDLEYQKKINLIAHFTQFGNPETANFNCEFEESLVWAEKENYFLEKEIKTKLKSIINSIEKLAISIFLNTYKIAKLKPKKIDFIDIWVYDYYKELKKYTNIQWLYKYLSTSFASRVFLTKTIIKKSYSDNSFNQKLEHKKTIIPKNHLNNIIFNTLFIKSYNKIVSKNRLEKENEYEMINKKITGQ